MSGNGSVAVNGGIFAVTPDGGGVFNQNVNFGADGSSTFELGPTFGSGHGAEVYTGVISGFSTTGSTTIELGYMVGSGPADVKYDGTKKGGILTITGDGQNATISFVGNYLNVTFTANMTASGTTIAAAKADTGVVPSTNRLVHAMAAFGAPSCGIVGRDDHSMPHPMELALAPRRSSGHGSLV